MATSGLYGSSPTGATVAAPGSESAGLYGNATTFGGSYFEWFIFIQSETQPATPTGGSWSFTTNSGTPPTGWSSVPPSAPTLPVWVSIALVNSKNTTALVWSAPGLFSYSSGLPILSGAGEPSSGDGLTNQLWIQTNTTPETIWFKQAGTWTRLTGSTLYADLTSNQTIAGTKTFSSQIQGSISGTASNVTGIVGITNGGTGSTTASGARTALGAAASGANSDITSLTGLTTALSIGQGGTGQTTANSAFNALAPSQTGNSGKYLTTDGSNTSWAVNPLGTVTSVNVSGGSTGLTASGGPITTSGTITLGGTLAVANGGTGVTASSGANSVVLRDSNQNVTANNFFNGFSTVAASATPITLTIASVPSYQVTGSGGQVFQLPNATTLANGASYYFNNNQSSGAITINNNSGTLVESVPSGGISTVVLLSNATAAGTWDRHDLAPSNVTWSTNTFDYPGSITSATWNGVAVAINRGGTGQTTANAAFNALAPSQTGNSGKYLTTDGSNTSWATNPLGTVTSVAATVPSFLSISGSPITTSGTLAFGLSGTALPTTSGGTGLTSFTANGVVYASSTSALTTGSALTFDGSALTVSASVAGASLTSSGAYSYLAFNNSGGATKAGLILTNSNGILQSRAETSAWTNYDGSSEYMRINSTGLGIGTNSPAYKLDVNGAINTSADLISQGSNARISLYRSTGINYFDWASGQPLYFSTQTSAGGGGRSTLMVLDSTGNLGVGINNPTGRLESYTSAASQNGLIVTSVYTTGNTSAAIFTAGSNNGAYSGGYGLKVFDKTANGGGAQTGIGIYVTSPYDGTNASGGMYALSKYGIYVDDIYSYYGINSSVGNYNWGLYIKGGANNYIAGNVGIGLTNPSRKLTVASETSGYPTLGTGSGGFFMSSNNGLYGLFGGVNGSNGDSWLQSMRNDAATAYNLVINPVGGNVGIGTSSPTAKLHVNGASRFIGDITAASDNTGSLNLYGGGSYTGGAGIILTGASAGTANIISFYNSSFTERARIDASGNFIVADTSAAFTSSGRGNITIGGANTSLLGFKIGGAGKAYIYHDGTNLDINNQANGFLSFQTNATERMRITSAGDVGIGTSLPTAKLTIGDGSATYKNSSASTSTVRELFNYVNTTASVATANGLSVGFRTSDAFPNRGASVRLLQTGNSDSGGDASSIVSFWTYSNGNDNGAERARIDSSGNLLVGATSGGSGKLRVSGDGTFNTSYGTPAVGYFFSSNSVDANCVEIYQGRFNKAGLVLSANNTGTQTQIAFYEAGSAVGTVTTTTTATAYNTSSDYRLKNTIAPMTGALAKVAQLKPVTYKWNADGSDGEGFIAHELAEVCPHAVVGEKDAVDEKGNPKYQGIDTSFLVATLTAAIQELKAEFDAYKASHP